MGPPIGNENPHKGKLWRAALHRALQKRADASGVHRNAVLDDLAGKLLAACDLGEQWALKELGDRLDGKPAQAIVGDDDGDPIRMVGRVVREIVRPNAESADG